MFPVRRQHRLVDAFTKQETQDIFDTAHEYFTEQYALVYLLFRTGLRLGEAVALTRVDIKFSEQSVIVSKNYTNGVLECVPKGGRARRVDLGQKVAAVLHEHMERMDLECQLNGCSIPTLLFPAPKGRYLRDAWWRPSRWYPLLKKAHVRTLSPHHARHTFATRLLENRESLTYVKDQLGHHSIQLTVDTYGHLVPGENIQAMDRLADG